MSDNNPKVFVSYSWTSPEHIKWVSALAGDLRKHGVDVIIDTWDLKPGNDSYRFMEQMVANPDIRKVVMVCDRGYAEKADARSGGVGAEAQIISSEIFATADQDKFVAVIAECGPNKKPFVPTYYRSRQHIDLSDADLYKANFERLLRWVYDKPPAKPVLGEKPEFISEAETDYDSSILEATSLRHALDATRNDKEYSLGALIEYAERLIEHLESLRLEDRGDDLNDRNMQSAGYFRSMFASSLFQISRQLEALGKGVIEYHREDWRGQWRVLLSDETVKHYDSIAQVINENYWQDETGRRAFEFCKEIAKKLKIRRAFVVSSDCWSSSVVRRFIHEHVDAGIEVRVVRREGLPDRLHLDLGVYGDLAVGYQTIDLQTGLTSNFQFRFGKKDHRAAKEIFETLWESYTSPDITDRFLHEQDP